MSKSYKKPYVSTTCIGDRAGVQKDWKRERNKVLRSKAEVPDGKAYRKIGGDIWDSPSDGKAYSKDEKDKRK